MHKILLRDNRIIEGNLLRKEKNMNVLLKNSIEYRNNKFSKIWEKREIGVCIIRGSCIILISR